MSLIGILILLVYYTFKYHLTYWNYQRPPGTPLYILLVAVLASAAVQFLGSALDSTHATVVYTLLLTTVFAPVVDTLLSLRKSDGLAVPLAGFLFVGAAAARVTGVCHTR